MMTPESVRAAMDAMRGWTYKDWKMFVVSMGEQFAQMADQNVMADEDNAAVMHDIAAWNEWPTEYEAPTQTRMGL